MRPALAFAVCAVVGVAAYPWLIGALARRRAGQRESGYGPASHDVKAGTPTMGGALFCAMAVAAWLLLDRTRAGFVLAFAVTGGALLGVLDDVANILGAGALGLRPRQKLVLQGLVGLCLGIGLDVAGFTRQDFPGLGAPDFHWLVVPLTVLAVVAATNAVNLTDGVDGLAGSCSALVLATLWALAEHAGAQPAAITSAALLGGVCAFLVYNWYPARVFMGDTGSLALGAAIAVVCAELRLLWLLPLLGAVFAVETLSVIVNVTAITRYGRRVFRASPLHHHFEELGLREERLVVWFASAAAGAAGLSALLALKLGVG